MQFIRKRKIYSRRIIVIMIEGVLFAQVPKFNTIINKAITIKNSNHYRKGKHIYY